MPVAVGGLLRLLQDDPEDQVARLILADLLDDLGPTQPRDPSIPDWLRRCWIRARKELTRPIPASRLRGGRRPIDKAGVRDEIETYLGVLLDHEGTATVAGLLCLVNEPYATAEQAVADLLPLSRLLGCALGLSRRAWHAHHHRASGLVRVILFPPLPPR